MATVVRTLHCSLEKPRPSVPVKPEPTNLIIQRGNNNNNNKLLENNNIGKIVLQPRLCTLRSYGPGVMMKTRKVDVDGGDVFQASSAFFETLSEYIESTRKSRDFETISGRFAMIVFAATVTRELVTGNSVFSKLDIQGLAEAAGLCIGAVAFAAVFAWLSSARNRVGSMFIVSYNTFIDTLVDQIVDGLFYETELTDWSDDI
ncbi:hypothetical protein ACFE04_017984 [Oxalis oulophora]